MIRLAVLALAALAGGPAQAPLQAGARGIIDRNALHVAASVEGRPSRQNRLIAAHLETAFVMRYTVCWTQWPHPDPPYGPWCQELTIGQESNVDRIPLYMPAAVCIKRLEKSAFASAMLRNSTGGLLEVSRFYCESEVVRHAVESTDL